MDGKRPLLGHDVWEHAKNLNVSETEGRRHYRKAMAETGPCKLERDVGRGQPNLAYRNSARHAFSRRRKQRDSEVDWEPSTT